MARATRVLFRLGCWIGGLLLFFCVIGPWLFSLSPAWQRYDAVQEEYGINSGAIFYSDVPVTQEAAAALQQAVREGMAKRKQRRLEERKAAEAQDATERADGRKP